MTIRRYSFADIAYCSIRSRTAGLTRSKSTILFVGIIRIIRFFLFFWNETVDLSRPENESTSIPPL